MSAIAREEVRAHADLEPPNLARLRRSSSRRAQWAIAGAVLLAGILADILSDFELDQRSWSTLAFVVATIGSVSAFYTYIRRTDDGRFAETLHEICLLVAYGPLAAMLSYLVAAFAFPLRDSELAGIDRLLGFDWPAWYRTVTHWPAFESALGMLYASSLLQLVFLLIATGISGRTDRARELNVLIMATSLPMILVSGVVPALCGWIHYGIGLEKAYHLEQVLGLRNGNLRALEVGSLLGIVTFPSFHTALAMVTVWVSRGIAWIFWPASILNVGVLLSLPTEGGHHLVDVLAGALITTCAIVLVRRHREPATGRS